MNRLLAAGLALLPLAAAADEGMFTYDAFPKDRVEKAYGFRVTDGWLEEARLASARLAQGCSGSFVSPAGLVMTNHHCAHSCIEQLSTAQRDFVKSGFYARAPADEVKCPELEVNQLVAIADVTARMTKATQGKAGQEFHRAQRAEQAAIEKACQTSPALRCEVVSLYRGGVYDLYTYRRYQDVRLAFAPEFDIAFFGGDPDNFTFPRYDLDVAFLRVYDEGKPAATPHHLRWSAAGARDGELTFVSGHPGGTSRSLTVAQLAYQRDYALPERLVALAEYRGLLTEYARRGPEQARHSTAELFFVENSFKAISGRLDALRDEAFFAGKVKAEQAFRAALAKDPAQQGALAAYDAIAGAVVEQRRLRHRLTYLEKLGHDDLLPLARRLVRAAAERAKPNAERLKEYSEAALPAMAQAVLSEAPLYPEFEVFRLTHTFTELRARLGADDPFVRKVLGKRSPAELAAELVAGTKVADPAFRRRLWEGGQAAVDEAAKTDALLAFARAIDDDARAVRKVNDEKIQPVLVKSQEALARARFALEGRSGYPDATFTLRLSYGAVQGYREDDGREVKPFTSIGGAFERATGRDPYALPRSWLEAEPRLDKAVPFDFVTSNDIIGGNSGSPVFNSKLEVVGLIFDGNIQSLGGDYGFDPAQNRTVAVHSAALLEALEKVYRADRIVE
ncbi:MAG TPA: S46 family peptidase, partial [Anaeromyxobacteraceae bacterium]|nr:S46 family peptidase [Anaeromyxobacteraceae bacterium]